MLKDGEIALEGDKPAVARALVSRCLDRIDPARRRRLAPLPPPPRVDFADPLELQRARAVLRAALADSGIDPDAADDPAAVPLLADGALVGIIVTGPGGEAVPFVLPEHQGRAIGDLTAERLAEMNRFVLAPRNNEAWWVARGWQVTDTIGGAIRLEPPGLQEPVARGASVALIHAPTDRILLGVRMKEPSKGMWAFPGGKIETGESIEQAALRELDEETRIRSSPIAPPSWSPTCSSRDGTGASTRSPTCSGRPQRPHFPSRPMSSRPDGSPCRRSAPFAPWFRVSLASCVAGGPAGKHRRPDRSRMAPSFHRSPA